MERQRTMSVDVLMSQLREGLLCIIPVLERVGLPWREEEGYDEWDRIAQALYESIVGDLVNASEAPGARGAVFAGYGGIDDYPLRALVAVESPLLPSGEFFFFRFATQQLPLDSVMCTTLELVVIDEFRLVPVDTCRFAVRLRQENGELGPEHYQLVIAG